VSVKIKIIFSMIITTFLAAFSVFVTSILLLLYFIDSNHLPQKDGTLFIFTELLVIVVFLGISIPIILIVAKNVSAPVEKMLDKTHFDGLTGIYNRRYFDENLKSLINFMSRSGGYLSLLMVEIDFFKEYNDTYGYNKGDNCLKIIAHMLAKGVSRAEDFVARYGGKEFVVVLPNADENGAHTIAQRLLSIIRECKIPHEKDGVLNYVTISIGAAAGKTDYSQSGDEYINKVSKLLDKSKQDGHNRYTFESL